MAVVWQTLEPRIRATPGRSAGGRGSHGSHGDARSERKRNIMRRLGEVNNGVGKKKVMTGDDRVDRDAGVNR